MILKTVTNFPFKLLWLDGTFDWFTAGIEDGIGARFPRFPGSLSEIGQYQIEQSYDYKQGTQFKLQGKQVENNPQCQFQTQKKPLKIS